MAHHTDGPYIWIQFSRASLLLCGRPPNCGHATQPVSKSEFLVIYCCKCKTNFHHAHFLSRPFKLELNMQWKILFQSCSCLVGQTDEWWQLAASLAEPGPECIHPQVCHLSLLHQRRKFSYFVLWWKDEWLGEVRKFELSSQNTVNIGTQAATLPTSHTYIYCPSAV